VLKAKQLKGCDAKLQGLRPPAGGDGSQFPHPGAKAPR